MNLLNKLTIKNLKLNKKRTIVTLIGIMLSIALITAVSTMYSSAISSLIRFEIKQKGNFHAAFYDVNKNDLETIKNNRGIKDFFITQNIGYAKLENSKNKNKPYLFFKAFSKKSLENLSVKLIEGRLPENENEILIPTHLKTNGRVFLNVGDELSLDIGKRMSEEYELGQSNPYDPTNNELIVNTVNKKFKIVGLIERPASNIEEYSAPGYTIITYTDEFKFNDTVDVYAKYDKKSMDDFYKITANILGVDSKIYEDYMNGKYDPENNDKIMKEISKSKYQSSINAYLLQLEANPFEDGAIEGLGKVVIVICIIIVFTSVFCIKNSFDISITEKIKQYGMLKSIGATKKQIRKNVLYEATILGIIGIPLGIILGLLASFVLIIITNTLIGSSMEDGLLLEFKVNIYALLFSVILGIITIYLSSILGARKASKISPIDSIRNSANIKIKRKKIKCPKIINKIFGIGGEISYKNLKRNKKKYRTTVISIIVSVSVFIALSSFINLAFTEIKAEIKNYDYNLLVTTSINDDEKLYDKLIEATKLDEIDECTIYRNAILYPNEKIVNSKYEKIIEKKDGDVLNNVPVMVVGKDEYLKYIKKLGLKYNDIKDKGIYIDKSILGLYDQKKKKMIYHNVLKYNLNKGDIVSGKVEEKDFNLEIGYTTDVVPLGFSINEEFSAILISDELYDNSLKDNDHIEIYIKTNKADIIQNQIDEILKGYEINIQNIAESVKMVSNFYLLIAIFLYGFIIVITLIGVTNIFNTITTNMELRKQEFAMLKSVGMTYKEFRRMIRLESVFMGAKSLLFSIPIGIILSYYIYLSLRGDSALKFQFPILAILISIIAVLLLITIIMKYSMNKINKQNTIETIRNENI